MILPLNQLYSNKIFFLKRSCPSQLLPPGEGGLLSLQALRDWKPGLASDLMPVCPLHLPSYPSSRAFNSCCCYSVLSHIRLFLTPRTVTVQASLSMGFPRQEHWRGLPFPPPGDLLHPGVQPKSVPPTLTGGFFNTEPCLMLVGLKCRMPGCPF